MQNLNFSITDKNLPLKITASFLLAAATVTAPLGFVNVVKSITDNSTVLALTRIAVDGSVLLGGSYWLKQQINLTVKDVCRQIQPLYRADLRGATIATFAAMGAGCFANASIFNQIPGFSSGGKDLTITDTLFASSILAVTAYEKVRGILDRNYWEPPKNPKPPNRKSHNSYHK